MNQWLKLKNLKTETCLDLTFMAHYRGLWDLKHFKMDSFSFPLLRVFRLDEASMIPVWAKIIIAAENRVHCKYDPQIN